MWFKVDDKLHDHRKTRKAGKSAMGVWVLAGSWAMDNETDGFIPADVLSRWGTLGDARKLVEAGLWREGQHKGEPGWRFHDWSRFQPSAAVTAAKRAAEHEAGIRGNHKRWHVARSITDPDCEYCYRVPDGVPDGVEDNGAISGRYPLLGESAPIPPEPVPVPEPKTTPLPDKPGEPDRFAEFWDAYDKKTSGRKPTEAKYRIALKKPGVTPDLLISAALSYVASQRAVGSHPKFTKDATRWLTGEHWDDETPTSDDRPAWGFQPPPPMPADIADDPRRFDAWMLDWSEGKPVVDSSGNTHIRRAS